MAEFDKIGVVGAGMMGSEIALMFALSGYPTLLSDRSPDAAKLAIERLHGVSTGAFRGASGQRRRQRQRGGISPSRTVSKLTTTAVSSSRLYSRTRI